MKSIHQWDLGGTETGSLSRCENHLCSNPPAGSLVAAATAGSGPWWQKCSSSFTWTSLAELEGHKGILRSSVSPKPCTYSAELIGEEARAIPLTVLGAASRLCDHAALGTPGFSGCAFPSNKITSSKHPYCKHVGLLIWGTFILKMVYCNVCKLLFVYLPLCAMCFQSNYVLKVVYKMS